jgi:hypothetical protein
VSDDGGWGGRGGTHRLARGIDGASAGALAPDRATLRRLGRAGRAAEVNDVLMLPRDVAGGPTSRPLGSPPRFYHIQERVKYYQCLLIRDPSGAELRRLFLEKGGDFSRKDEMSLRELVRGGHHNPAPHRPGRWR